MKLRLFITSTLFFALNASAECNLSVATSAGQYLNALEKVQLTKYQNNSVCEVLHYEFWNCSKSQKAKLEKSVNIKEVLGTYCGPHLSPPKPSLTKDQLMKGASLYSWKDQNGYYWYALLPGTNRTKPEKEILENKISEGYLKEELTGLPPNTDVMWNNEVTVEDKKNLELVLPPEKVVKEMKAKASAAMLKLTVIELK